MPHIRAFGGRSVLTTLGLAALLTACDPVYRVGARQQLSPLKPPASDSVPVVADSVARPSDPTEPIPHLSVPLLADCLEGSLRSSAEIISVTRTTRSKQLRSQHISFALTDSTVKGQRRYLNLSLDAWPHAAPMLELYFSWIGTAKSVSLADQRTMVRIATDLLTDLRAACSLPRAEIECIAEGWGDRGTCRA
jgi:hypothetical protein